MSAQPQRVVGVEFGREVPPRSFATLLPPPWRQQYDRIDLLAHPDIRDGLRSPAEQADHWARWLGGSDGPTVVLGYCSGAAVAAELARLLGAGTRLVLIDPSVPTAGEAQELLVELARGLDEELRSADVPDIRAAGPAEAFALSADLLRTLVDRCAPDLPDDIAGALSENQRVWMSYTLAAGAHRGSLRHRPDLVLLSADGSWEPDPATLVRRFPAGPTGLFTDPAAAAALADALGPGGGGEGEDHG
ncbi:hypothetical protein [Kitasatospora sp. NPDC047058]|uniref:hypothetical protein n=1 Tax=Kitasatospora sp. NPDC047058 TaxID=3155620 RepID=UPI0033CA332B